MNVAGSRQAALSLRADNNFRRLLDHILKDQVAFRGAVLALTALAGPGFRVQVSTTTVDGLLHRTCLLA